MATQEKSTNKHVTTEPDRNAPAGTKNSLGAESIRDGRPSTDDNVAEAIDEVGPGATASPSTEENLK